jgi:hypothetical protein
MTEPPKPGEGQFWCKNHCASCDECFRSIAAFDAHRRGSHYKNTRHCCDPATLRGRETGELVLVGIPGRCRMSNTRGVWESLVYRLTRDDPGE